MTMPELKLCPFCGNDEASTMYNPIGEIWCFAIGCGAKMIARTEDEAITLWNKRVLSSAEPNHCDLPEISRRILAVGGRNNEAGYVEFGSTQAVRAFAIKLIRDQVTAALIDIDIHEEVEGYEWRGDGDYTPNDQEKALLEDFGNGLIGRIDEVIRRHNGGVA